MDAWFSAWTELWIQNVSGLLLVLGPQWFQTLKREGNAGPIEASCSGAWELVPLGYPDRAPTETPRLVSRWNGVMILVKSPRVPDFATQEAKQILEPEAAKDAESPAPSQGAADDVWKHGLRRCYRQAQRRHLGWCECHLALISGSESCIAEPSYFAEGVEG